MKKIKFDKSWLLFMAAAAVFLAIKIHAAHYAISDENTYYKMGQLVAQGQVPYRDFFFAHLPLQIYLYAAIFKIFGFSIIMLKMASATATIGTAAFVFAITKEKLNATTAGAASILFLFSYGTLLFSQFPTGAELAAPFVTAAFYFYLRKKFLAAGALAGIGTATYQLSALAFAALIAMAMLALRDRKAAVRLMIGFLAIIGSAAAVFLILAKGELIRQTVFYHFQKPAEGAGKAAIFLRIAKTNALLLILAAAGLLSKSRAKITVAGSAAIAAGYILAFPLIKTAFNYYMIFALPFLAIVSAYGINLAFSFLTERIRLTKAMSLFILSAIILASSFYATNEFASYKMQDFGEAEAMAEYVKEGSTPEQELFGDDSTVPLISILSEREIALNHIDNNAMRYRSGQANLEKALQRLDELIKKGKLKFIILRRIKTDKGTYDFGIGTEKKFIDFLSEKCIEAARFGQHAAYNCLKK